jgi:hypothetical protein
MYRLTVVYDEPADKLLSTAATPMSTSPSSRPCPGWASPAKLSHPQGGTPYLAAELFWPSEDAFKPRPRPTRWPSSARTPRAAARRSRSTPATSPKSDRPHSGSADQ